MVAPQRLARVRRFALLLLLYVLTLSSLALAKSWEITDFHDTVSISESGRIVVSERIELSFVGEWHGIHRTVPVEYPGPHGTNYSLFMDIISITDGD